MSRRLFEELSINGRAFPKIMASVQSMNLYIEAVRRRMPDWNERTQRMALAEMRFASSWVAAGQIVYTLTHNMAAMFAMTSSPALDWKHAPHEAFVITVPRRYLPVEGSFPHEYTYIYASQWGTLLVPDWDTTATMILRYGDLSSRDGLENAEPSKIAASMKEFADDLGGRRRDTYLELALEDVKRLMPGVSEAEAQIMATDVLKDQQAEVLRAVAELPRYDKKAVGQKILLNRFVSNVVAYVTEHRPTLSRCGTGETSRLVSTLSPPAEVVVDRAFRDVVGDAVDSILQGSIAGIRRALAHRVRGHWRDQPYGTGRSERRRIWIMPHRRGDEALGSVVRRIEHIQAPVKVN